MKILLILTLTITLARGAGLQPNIVFILADDLGITDINAYARHFNKVSPVELFYETPHLDKLAADGIAFSQSYANQLCSPTRAAVLTGRIASRMGVTTATPNTKTYFNQGKKVPKGHAPHDVLKHEDPIPGKRPWINASSNTGLDSAIPTWPRVLKSHDCTDFLPSVAELTGNAIPEGIDGRSMLPLLANPASPGPERTLIWHYPFNVSVKHPDNGKPLSPHSAIRVGDHKLIWDWHGKLELYHIPNDPAESNDLSQKMPELTTKLHTQLKQWLKQNVAPRYWPQRDETVSPTDAGGPFPFRDLR